MTKKTKERGFDRANKERRPRRKEGEEEKERRRRGGGEEEHESPILAFACHRIESPNSWNRVDVVTGSQHRG